MSVTAPLGFRAAGVTAGLKASGDRDVAVVINDGPSRAAAAVFTSNRVHAAPVKWSRQVVSGGRVRGRVRVVRPDTIDDLEAGEILVAEVTDVGYTAAFSYAGAVVTELGGPMSHAAVVAREFGIPCVVDVHDATRLLPPGVLIEVDGTAGTIQLLEADLPSATT